MSAYFDLRADQGAVADLREMRALYREGQGLPVIAPEPVPSVGAIVIETISTITAGDHGQKQVKIVTLSNGSWVDTAQRIYVRNIGAESVAADTRLIARPIGALGLCVFGGCPVPSDTPAAIP